MTATSFMPGWFGKIPSNAEFISRQLDSQLVAQFSSWLDTAMSGLKVLPGFDWQKHFIDQPTWHFILPGGVFSPMPILGVMAASYDSVGRFFPLVVCAAVGNDWPVWLLKAESLKWFEQVSTSLKSAIAQRISTEQMELVLTRLPAVCMSAEDRQMSQLAMNLTTDWYQKLPGSSQIKIKTSTPMDTFAKHLGQMGMLRLFYGQSLWWTVDTEMKINILRYSGLPDASTFRLFTRYQQ